jgi:hypothetical protein
MLRGGRGRRCGNGAGGDAPPACETDALPMRSIHNQDALVRFFRCIHEEAEFSQFVG